MKEDNEFPFKGEEKFMREEELYAQMKNSKNYRYNDGNQKMAFDMHEFHHNSVEKIKNEYFMSSIPTYESYFPDLEALKQMEHYSGTDNY